MAPGEETCIFAIQEQDDGTVPHHYGPCDEFYYILEGEFTVWWGSDVDAVDENYVLKPGDCTHYNTGWKYKIKITGDGPGRFFYFLTNPMGIEHRFD